MNEFTCAIISIIGARKFYKMLYFIYYIKLHVVSLFHICELTLFSSQNLVPVKWTALESLLHGRFTTASDV